MRNGMQAPVYYFDLHFLNILLLTHYALNMHKKPLIIDGLGCHVLHGMSFLALTRASSITERF